MEDGNQQDDDNIRHRSGDIFDTTSVGDLASMQLAEASTPLSALPLEALELNVKLHAVLKVLVKGSKEALLQQQNCGGWSYVHAVICLHKHRF